MINNIFPGDPSVEEIVSKNRYGVRQMETSYFRNQYNRVQETRNKEKLKQLQLKAQERSMVDQLNNNYQRQANQQRQHKINQMRSLSIEYEDFIRSKEEQKQVEKLRQKHVQNSTLTVPTWVRDTYSQRDNYKKNMQRYGRALDDHLRLQQIKKDIEKQQENRRQIKADEQAKSFLKKEYQWLESRHRYKSQFEKRQNQILGVKIDQQPSSQLQGLLTKQELFKKRESDLYKQGLSIQLQKEENKNIRRQEQKNPTSYVYNTITNPIPFIYKNPNVLKMMAQS